MDFTNAWPNGDSFSGGSVRETRMVSPMPISNNAPMPAADFTLPSRSLPASVTPR